MYFNLYSYPMYMLEETFEDGILVTVTCSIIQGFRGYENTVKIKIKGNMVDVSNGNNFNPFPAI